MNYLLDTNVIMQLMKNNRDLVNWIYSLNVCLDTTVYIECLQGQKTNIYKNQVKKFIDGFALVPLSEEIGLRATDLVFQYSNSHNLLLPDSLIAAATIEADLILITYNIDDFKFIKGLNVIKPQYPQI